MDVVYYKRANVENAKKHVADWLMDYYSCMDLFQLNWT